VVRLFNVYYPVRTLVLVGGEALLVWNSLLLGTILRFREDSYLVLNFEYGYYKLLLVTACVLVFSHWMDLYDPVHFRAEKELYFRLPLVTGLLALMLGAVGYVFPGFMLGNQSFLWGLLILTFALFGWRAAYAWLMLQPFLRERVYVLGTGQRAQRLVNGLRTRPELGIDVAGWSGDVQGEVNRDAVAQHLAKLVHEDRVHRVIVAMPDRRGTIPVNRLLQLRLQGMKIEEAASWLEKISGRIEVDQLYPSWLLFAEGFRFSSSFTLLRRVFSCIAAIVLLILVLPIIPLVVLVIKLDSSGRALYRQQRVGRGGQTFFCYKFRTMRADAEADTGATWATDDDPRITRAGRFLRKSRLDEIPQLWNVLKGDMAFVGPRPERPEFVQWLSEEIPFYSVRHAVPPGITGWAQIRHKYGNTLEDAREKLQYDLYYIKNMSVGLDLLIAFHTIKIVILGRGAR